ncbi:MAG: hypothetical protein AAGD11_10140 [Planctomycetota bacterium]
MSSATYTPRCPHRMAKTVSASLWMLCIASQLSLTTAIESLRAEELLDYRLVDPASHMQPWPDDESDILITPPATVRIATKWRTNLTGSRKLRTPAAEEPAQSEASSTQQQPSPSPVADSTLPLPVVDAPAASTPLSEESQPVAADAEKVVTKAPTALAIEVATENPELISPPTKSTITAPPATSEPSAQTNCYRAPALTELSTSIALPDGELPTDVATLCAGETSPTGDARLYGGWACVDYHWSATCMHHRPLYFEEINAERYGYTISYALQPVISAARFFATIPALPYKMAVDGPRDCVYTLGYYRPGSCVPRRCNRPPFSLRGSAVETGVIAGLILLIP